MKCHNHILVTSLRLRRPSAVLADKKGMILATVIVMSVLIMALCSTVVILASYNNNRKLLDYRESENRISLRAIGNTYLALGEVADENDDGVVDGSLWTYVILSDADNRSLVLRSSDSSRILLIVSEARSGEDWIAAGWYEYPDGIPIVTETADCTHDGERVYELPNGLVYAVESMPATGHDFENGTCTICGVSES